MYKKCKKCNCKFSRNVNYSDKQWENSLFCSRKCFGENKRGIPMSEEQKIKISIKQKGMKKPWAGKYKHSKEHNKNISKSLYKFYSTEKGNDIRQKISQIHTGKKMSEQQLIKHLELMKLRPNYKGGIETRKKRKSFSEQRRKSKRKQNEGSHTLEQWEDLKKFCNYTCQCCKKQEPEIKLTEDHIIPISKDGSDFIENIQPLCVSCNSKKSSKIIYYE